MTKRTERGWAGHFICAHNCQYHRNTLLEHESGVSVVVSTVGNYWPPHHAKKDIPAQIGCDRYYETMAFLARNEGAYVEADTCRAISLNDWAIGGKVDWKRADLIADEMHEANVAEVARRMESGEGLGANDDE